MVFVFQDKSRFTTPRMRLSPHKNKRDFPRRGRFRRDDYFVERSRDFPYEVNGHEESSIGYSNRVHNETRSEINANPFSRPSRDQRPLNQGRFKQTRKRVTFGVNRIIYPTEENGFMEQRNSNTRYFPHNGEKNGRREFSAQRNVQFAQNYSHQKKRMGQKTHSNTQKKSKYSPASPTFRNVIKNMYHLIRSVHHLSNIDTRVENNQPVTLKRLTELLKSVIKPFAPTMSTKEMLEGNARNWAFTTQLVLQQHYEDIIQHTLGILRGETQRTDWLHAFEIAVKWAMRNFGKRISQRAIQQAETLVLTELRSGTPSGSKGPSASGADNNRTFAQVVSGVTPAPVQQGTEMISTEVVRPKTGVTHIQVQTSPTLMSGWSPMRNDWLLGDDFPPLSPPIQAPVQSPRGKRKEKKKHLTEQSQKKPSVVTEHSEKNLLVDFEDDDDDDEDQLTPAQGNRLEDLDEITNHLSQELFSPLAPSEADAPKATGLLSLFPMVPSTVHTVNPLLDTTERAQILQSPSVSPNLSDFDLSVYSLTTLQPEAPQEVESSESSEKMEENISETDKCRKAEKISKSDKCRKAEKISKSDETTVADNQGQRSTHKPYMHLSTNKKFNEWKLTLKEKHVIIGDSNLGRIPTFDIQDLQIDSFPGAKLQHAANLIEKATVGTKVEKIVLAFGLNNRTQRLRISAMRECARVSQVTQEKLPDAQVWIPLINIPQSLPEGEKIFLDELNNYIEENYSFIPLLPEEQFQVERDGLHWTAETARNMLEHWTRYLNL